MSLSALLFSAVIDSLSPKAAPLACTFPDAEARSLPISVEVRHNPSLFDRAGRFQVQLVTSDVGEFDAAAGPSDPAGSFKVMIRGKRDEGDRIAVAVRADGGAVLKTVTPEGEDDELRRGRCRHFEPYLRRWTS
ncbi:hypothetical protein [Tranquillimonas alkanivorans]|uniref:Uncharacterized protein n=1 Tax=Tranquillimonas alkanivorans TaxID=441119 RepID=A0A1I5P3Z4_9RHOB|nr:hypothetical protein [Tranquillimonas alkanivorans]SFP28241.1 hypothetical protein SAMN04488047_104204 [Tranquillimonas alkanivorans]